MNAQILARRSGILAALVAIFLGGCNPYFSIVNKSPEVSPPYLVDARMTAPDSFVLTFSSKVVIGAEDVLLGSDLVVAPGYPLVDGTTAKFILEGETLLPGRPLPISGTAASPSGDTTWFSVNLFGYNASPAVLSLNEVRIVHSTASPEAVELVCLVAGNLGGVSLVVGLPDGDGQKLRFPPLEVDAGQTIVVLFRAKPEELSGEEGNWDNRPPSSPVVAGALNFYLPAGLSDTAALVSVWSSPILDAGQDAVMYTNKTDNPEDRYRGFGTSAALQLAAFLAESGLWADGAGDPELVNPGDFASSSGATVTRTLNRRPGAAPGLAAGRGDWFIGASGTASIGGPNTDQEYAP